MATTPPTELPPPSFEPTQPDSTPTELPAPTPDVDFPAPGTTEPGTADPQALSGDFA